MQYSKINNTNLISSKIILGTDGFGTEMSMDLSFKMLNEFVNDGGNTIDTASAYADWRNMGKSISEKTIGKWLKQRKKRDDIIISTKGGHPDFDKMDISRLSKKEINKDFENSLINLQTDYVDIYWLHKDDENISPEQLIEIMNDIIKTGKARYIGVSNWKYDRIKQANSYAVSNGLQPFIASQIQYSIAKINTNVLGKDICVMTQDDYIKYSHDDINVFAFSSQAKGFFSIIDNGGIESLPLQTKNEFLNDYNLKLYEKIKLLSHNKNVGISSVLLNSLISDANVNTFAQIGPRKIEHLHDSLKCVDFTINQDEMEYLLN